jgi:hypothetical protein
MKLRRYGIPYDFCTSVFRGIPCFFTAQKVVYLQWDILLKLKATVVQTRTGEAQTPVLLTRPGAAQAFVDKSRSKTGEAHAPLVY